jgi:putative ABC transport system permease protein
VATVLNIFGLSVAFAAFIVIMIQVNFERSYDRCHPKADRIFRVDMVRGQGNDFPVNILPRPFVNAIIQSSPHIEAGALLMPIDEWVGDLHILVGDSADRRGFLAPLIPCYPNITQIFGYEFTEGDGSCLNNPGMAIIPQSLARRMFGDEPATGKMIYNSNQNFGITELGNMTIGGVYKDFPANTQIKT